MTLKGDAKFKGKQTCGLKNDIRNLVSFNASSRKSEELCLITLKSDAKLEEKLTLGSKKDMRNLVNFKAKSGKSENL